MNSRVLAVTLAALLAASACQRQGGAPSSVYAPIAPEADKTRAATQQLVTSTTTAARDETSGGEAQAPGSVAPAQSQQPVPVPVQRKIIRNGTADIEVASAEKTAADLKSRVVALGGYVGNEAQTQNEYGAKAASITCRLPAEKLDEFLQGLKGMGTLETLSVTAQDITEEYYDLQIRIENQRKLEASLLDLLKRQTNNLSELLEIEREVARVRGEIDQMEGRRRFWDSQVAFSTVVVNMHEPRPVVAGGSGGAWHTLTRSFREFGENFVMTIAGIIAASGAILPVAAFFLLIFWIVAKIWRRRRQKRLQGTSSPNGGTKPLTP